MCCSWALARSSDKDQEGADVGCAPKGSCDNTLIRTVLRKDLDTAFGKVPMRVLRSRLAVDFRGRKGSEKGSLKGV